MVFFPLRLPPGIYRNGTEQQAAGRYFDANLVRWISATLRPMGGWRPRSTAGPVTGVARALLSWRDNGGSTWIAISTHTNLYVQAASGTNTDITPASGFIAGRDKAEANLGYGGGFYERGAYGTPRASTGASVLPATVWSLDKFGQYLVGCHADDGKLWQWRLDTGQKAEQIENAPTACRGLVVTENRMLMALGASGVGRRVKWCDQGLIDSWAISATSQAGEFDLETRGRLMCGRAMKGLTLLFTDVDVWGARYLGYPLVYGFRREGEGCGVISQGAVASVDQQAAWMGQDSFWLYDGSVQPLPCDVQDLVFNDINTSQASKITATHYAAHGEVWWHYPSSASIENDRYVIWNYRDGYWNAGAMARTCGADKGVNSFPLRMGPDGILYEHEIGWDYDDAEVFAEGGPLSVGGADRMMEVQGIVGDELTGGSVSATFKARAYPNAPEQVFGPYPLNEPAGPTDMLFQARFLKVRYTANAASDWRVGEPLLDTIAGDPM